LSIFYFCPWVDEPNGGTKQIHRHVEALKQAGIDAYVLTATSARLGWFDSTAPGAVIQTPAVEMIDTKLRRRNDPLRWLRAPVGPMVSLAGAQGASTRRRLTADDIVVVPEFYGKKVCLSGFGARVVIFNQNAHYTFLGFHVGDDPSRFAYHRDVLGVLAVSDQNVEYLKFAFPNADVLLTRNGIDLAKFHPAEPKKRRIAFMPRKLPRDLVQVLQILKGRGSLNHWELCAIDNMGEAEVAQLMRESAFFLSTCDAEGFGLPPLEAAACGCIVVGYCGQAAREFMQPQHCFPIDQGDVLTFAKTLERLLQEYEKDPSALTRRALSHAEFVQQNYSREVEGASVLRAWSQLLQSEPQRAAGG